jgi:hypothetical protein
MKKSEVTMKTPLVVKRLKDAAADSLMLVGFSLQKRVKHQLSKEGSGEWYSGNPARSSRFDEPPVSQTGRLRNSMVAGKRNFKRKKNLTGATIMYEQIKSGSAPIYGYLLETKKGRPFIKPALKILAPRAPKIFNYMFTRKLKEIDAKGPGR